VEQQKPVMAFLHGDPDSIPVAKAERSEAAQEKLMAFRSKIQGAKHVKYWSNPDDLAGKVALITGAIKWGDVNFAFVQLRHLRGHTPWPPP
jgi:hypothetical protein